MQSSHNSRQVEDPKNRGGRHGWGRSAFPALLPTLSWLSLMSALLALALAPAQRGYELSVYDALPSLFWICLLLSFILGYAHLLTRSARMRRRLFTVAASFSIVASDGILLLLPTLRGYPFYGRHHPLTHVGMT